MKLGRRPRRSVVRDRIQRRRSLRPGGSSPSIKVNQGLESRSITELPPELLEGFQGKEKAAGLAGKGTNAIALIERLCALVPGIDDDGINRAPSPLRVWDIFRSRGQPARRYVRSLNSVARPLVQ